MIPIWIVDAGRAVGIIGDVGLSMEASRSVAGEAARTIKIGAVYPATIGVLPAFLARIGRKFPDVGPACDERVDQRHVRSIENSQIRLRRLIAGSLAYDKHPDEAGTHLLRVNGLIGGIAE
ncbi:hypothetical protein [Ensifer adhaerens]|uniref:hypothetical protein n=1 Tax=Ensifer adhaerens TaxID=106592 RepID=UPI0008072D7E